MPEGTVELLSDDAARQVSDILDAGGTSGGRPERAAGQDRERRRENIDRLLDVLPVTMVTKDGNHQVTAEEVMAMADRTEHAADMAEEPETAAASSTDTPARTDASEPERAEDAPSSGMEAGTVSTPELIAKKIELFGIKVGRFEVAQLIRRGAGPEAIADIADSYDLNLRNGMESGEARLAAEREHGYAPDRTVADATRSEDVDDEPDIDFGSPERELAARLSCRRAALGRRSASSSPTMISTGSHAMRPTRRGNVRWRRGGGRLGRSGNFTARGRGHHRGRTARLRLRHAGRN